MNPLEYISDQPNRYNKSLCSLPNASILWSEKVVSEETKKWAWFMETIGIESWMPFWFGNLRRLWNGESEIEYEIMEIVGVRSRFPYTTLLFRLGIKNGCYSSVKEPKMKRVG